MHAEQSGVDGVDPLNDDDNNDDDNNDDDNNDDLYIIAAVCHEK